MSFKDNKDSYVKSLEQKIKVLKELVVLDPLTKILNRRGIDEQFEVFDSIFKRYQIDYFVSFIDIKNFKQINDNKGHLAGDEILKKIAQSIKSKIRKSDVVGRLGGDEFMVLFHSRNKNDFSLVCKELFTSIQNELNIRFTYVTAKRSNFNGINGLLEELDQRLVFKKKNEL
ncbi:MAG: Unknown protein [uncultured Campylobacterales bacterium]|uniref:diguanylate cyclase n=1 Tax=uncultured Campylobacterales bacterium TaxID=352960 RepID=A0A6S6T3Q6_9BACT|nr:MAG: Unknown protein [uncultured Campylobacterales bacterium]